MTPVINNPKLFKSQFQQEEVKLNESRLIQVQWYLNSPDYHPQNEGRIAL